MTQEIIWYIVSITDQLRDLLLAFMLLTGIFAIIYRNKWEKVTILLIAIFSLLTTAHAFIPNKELAREMAAIKYGNELSEKRVQDKLYFYKKKTFEKQK